MMMRVPTMGKASANVSTISTPLIVSLDMAPFETDLGGRQCSRARRSLQDQFRNSGRRNFHAAFDGGCRNQTADHWQSRAAKQFGRALERACLVGPLPL
jgi:hypothetical protein